MSKKNKKVCAGRVGVMFGIGTFVALSFLAGGLIEVSHDVGFFRWLTDFTVYTFTNKLVYKLIASFAIGGFASFAASMVAYGKAIKQHKVERVQFDRKRESDSATRIA